MYGGFDFLRVFDAETVFTRYDKAYVADLAAAFGVERGLFQNDYACFACFKFVHGFTAFV